MSMRLARLRLADHGQRDVALGAQLGHRLEQVRQALEGDVGGRGGDQPVRDALHLRQRLEQLRVDADGHEAHAVAADAHVGVDVVDAVLADDDDARQARRDAALHLHERVPAADAATLAPGRRVAHLQLAILRDRVVQRDDRRDLALDRQDAVAEALVVVHEVELAGACLEVLVAPGSRTRGARRTCRVRNWAVSTASATLLVLPVRGQPAGVRVVEDVEARQLGERAPDRRAPGTAGRRAPRPSGRGRPAPS